MAKSAHGNKWPVGFQIVLGLALLAAGCASTPSVDQERWSLDDPGEEGVTDAAEVARMQQHIDSLYEPSDVVHRFTTASGEAIDCIDLRRQPGLRGGAETRAQALELLPRTLPVDDVRPRVVEQEALHRGGYDETGAERRCPETTIPVLRLTLDAMKRYRTLEDFRRKAPSQLDEDERGTRAGRAGRHGSFASHQYAHASERVLNMGAEVTFNLWSPYTSHWNEFSLSQLWVSRGSGMSLETVEAGWQVYRGLYGDDYARLFVYFTPDAYRSGGCYNLTCGAFVQVSSAVVLGGRFAEYSVTDGPQVDIQIMWHKDGPTGNWWLRVGPTWVGYYPRARFDSAGLADHADRIDFGGEIVNVRSNNAHTSTDMGSGAFPDQGWQRAAYQRNIRYLDTRSMVRDATLTPSVTDPFCYDIQLSNGESPWGTYFFFGGSGYNALCQ